MDVKQFLKEDKSLLRSITTYCKKHFGIIVRDADFQNIGKRVVSQQSVQGYYSLFFSAVMILKLQESKKSKFDLEEREYRTPLGKQALRYLKDAGECFTYNLSIAGIMLCRLSVELALKDRIIEEKIKLEEIADTETAIIESLKQDFSEICMLGCLIQKAKENWNIISFDDIKTIFLQVFKRINSNLTESDGHSIFNKFAHGDTIDIQEFLQERLKIGKDTEEKVVFKMVTTPGIIDNFLFYSIYEATYEILIKLYFNE